MVCCSVSSQSLHFRSRLAGMSSLSQSMKKQYDTIPQSDDFICAPADDVQQICVRAKDLQRKPGKSATLFTLVRLVAPSFYSVSSSAEVQ